MKKVALVTGASSGIGLDVSLALLSKQPISFKIFHFLLFLWTKKE